MSEAMEISAILGIAFMPLIELDNLGGGCRDIHGPSYLKSINESWHKFIERSSEESFYYCDLKQSKHVSKVYVFHQPDLVEGVCKGVFEVLYFENLKKSMPFSPFDRQLNMYVANLGGDTCNEGEAVLLSDNMSGKNIAETYGLIKDSKSKVAEKCGFTKSKKISVAGIMIGRPYTFELDSNHIFYRLYLDGTICDVGFTEKSGNLELTEFHTYIQ
ncbi:hypothetical protein ACNKU7_10960 [Microbulbifer sp. SA54]|uniref:hypothetical protein n=1 Tax=Microbulbifer sp. SA54 TaxID=3401577 RepID=UPI003AAD7061